VKHHARILADGIEHDWIAKGSRNLADDPDRLGFELAQMRRHQVLCERAERRSTAREICSSNIGWRVSGPGTNVSIPIRRFMCGAARIVPETLARRSFYEILMSAFAQTLDQCRMIWSGRSGEI
jgi:hypothetical protein